MDVRRFKSTDRYEPDEGWERVSLADEAETSVEWFRKPAGHSSPMHDHPNAQVCIVLSGELVIHTREKRANLGVYDAAFLEAEEPHRVENTDEEPAVGLDIFIPGRDFDFWSAR